MIRSILVEIVFASLIITAFWAFLSLIRGPKAKRLSCPPDVDHEGDEVYDEDSPSGLIFVCRNCTYREIL